jgi:predicted nucleic acid-binding protein
MRVLVDTSIWINHVRKSDPVLDGLLQEDRVVTHPFVIGELALGSIRSGDKVVANLLQLPCVSVVDQHELLVFIEAKKLSGTGIGFVDASLLASAAIAQVHFWTSDRNAAAIALRLDVAFQGAR